jgi:hypothetical protein
MSDEPTAIDFDRLTAEINDEVRRRRAAGDFPPGLERELDLMFARYAPASTGGDFAEVLERAERSSFVHADVPTASDQPMRAYVKRALRPLVAWYARFLAQQVTSFAGTITRAVQLLGQRVDKLETITTGAAERSLAEVTEHRQAPDHTGLFAAVSLALSGASGRILHAECGEGALLAKLVGDGHDAYGVEPRQEQAMVAARSGLDVRSDDVLTHLRAIPSGALGGIVLSGAIDVLPLGSVLELAELAATKLDRGGVLAIMSSAPAAWARAVDPVAVDLAPGRPLHPQTWCHLLATTGFGPPAVHELAPEPGATLDPVPDTTPGADALNANMAKLNALLFAPTAYAVIATRA